MRYSIRALAAAAFGAAVFVPAAQAQDMTTYSFGGTTLYIGGGFQYLSLPDIKFTGAAKLTGADEFSNFRPLKNIDFNEYGPAAGAGIETAIGYWNGMRVTAGVKGFYTWLENSNRTTCLTGSGAVCLAIDPTGEDAFGASGFPFITKTERDVDYWGGQVEFKFGHAKPVHAKPNFYRNDYFIVGADIRGIDQNTKLVNRVSGVGLDQPFFTYNETLDTTYYGGYIGIGGEYSFGFIPFLGSAVKGVGGIYDRFGLRTFINLRGGLYNAETDYHGRFAAPAVPAAMFPAFSSRLSKSDDELAFIGTVSLETRKQLGQRTSLSLWTDYEYISSVPDMRYTNGDRPTRIEDDDAFATRTMLRLNIGLGSAQLYPAPPP